MFIAYLNEMISVIIGGKEERLTITGAKEAVEKLNAAIAQAEKEG